jgi:hypothetical protein
VEDTYEAAAPKLSSSFHEKLLNKSMENFPTI